MEIDVEFPGESRVDAHLGRFTVRTDQPLQDGGGGSAPSPFDLFLAATATCAGYYVQSFCRQRGISTAAIHLVQRQDLDPNSGHVTKLMIEIQLPPEFPEKYRMAVIRAAEQCTVKKQLQHPPAFEIGSTRVTAVTA